MKEIIYSWGRLQGHSIEIFRPGWIDDAGEIWSKAKTPMLAYGMGRSYGDSCMLSSPGVLMRTDCLNRFISFDTQKGVLRCESGVKLSEILQLIVPQGWFLPVTPGSKFITVGGAVANDVHGKNHHQAGTFGCHVNKIALVRRSTPNYLECSPMEHPELFRATIGGLGLTGLMLWVEIKLKKGSPWFDVETIKFSNLEDFFNVSEENDKKFEYSVSWVDCTAKGKNLGRGVYMGGAHSHKATTKNCQIPLKPFWPMPLTPPNWTLNPYSIQIFNQYYFQKHQDKHTQKNSHFDSFFYPLDSIANWNRIYGKRGFYQYQFVIPLGKKDILKEIFELIATSQNASFLAVLKTFGNIPSPGMLSFPKSGYTLALDFPNCGQKTLDLFTKLDNKVFTNQGRIYPGKDARMSADHFQDSMPNIDIFCSYIDKNCTSGFWKRTMGSSK